MATCRYQENMKKSRMIMDQFQDASRGNISCHRGWTFSTSAPHSLLKGFCLWKLRSLDPAAAPATRPLSWSSLFKSDTSQTSDSINHKEIHGMFCCNIRSIILNCSLVVMHYLQ